MHRKRYLSNSIDILEEGLASGRVQVSELAQQL